MSIPIDLLYCGFKVSFLATAALEEMIFRLIREYAHFELKTNAHSHSLEELLLSMQGARFAVVKDEFELHITQRR